MHLFWDKSKKKREEEKDQKKRNFEKQLMILYKEDLRRFVISLTADIELAAEILQSVALKALEKQDQLKNEEAMKSWLFSIAKNEVRKYNAKNRREISIDESELAEMIERSNQESKKEIDASLLQNEQNKVILSSINSLDIKYQQVLLLRYYAEMSLLEISEVLNVNYSTIKTLHRRALIQLEEQLSEEKESAF